MVRAERECTDRHLGRLLALATEPAERSEPVELARLGRLGAGEERLAEDARARGLGELAGVAIDVDEGDAVGRLRSGTFGRPASAAIMNRVQIGSAACAPLRPSGWLSSKPTHTTVSSSGVKPDEPGVAQVVGRAGLARGVEA